MVGFNEHLELDIVGVLEYQYRSVFAFDHRRLAHAELLEPRQPLIEAGAHGDLESHVTRPWRSSYPESCPFSGQVVDAVACRFLPSKVAGSNEGANSGTGAAR